MGPISILRNIARRRGSAYLLVLGVSSIVFVIGVGAIGIVRVQARVNGANADASTARAYAQSAIDLGRLLIAQDPNWRFTHKNGMWIARQAFGGGNFSLEVVNPKGALTDSETAPTVLTATGVKGQALQKVQVTLLSVITPSPGLQTAFFAGGDLTFSSALISPFTGVIASNGYVSAVSGSTVNAAVEAAGKITGTTYNGSITMGVALRALPASTAFDYYIANGTPITISGKKMKKVLLSPAVNPYGALNSRGIYILDCQGNDLTIEECRVVGTLVMLNAGPGTKIGLSANFAAAISNYPCLMVQGNITIDLVDHNLIEQGTSVQNLNPAGTPYPYPSGIADNDTSDSYPAAFVGLVYVSGNLIVSDDTAFRNVIVGGTFWMDGTMTISPDAALLATPPPGMYTTSTPVLAGSWTQIVS